jgi:uncharacterized Zn-binding protein involved in type VI secretion
MPAAARFSDMTIHGTPFVPGLGSTNVLIGNLPALRAMSPAAVAAFVALVAEIAINAQKLATALTASNAPAALEAGNNLKDQIPDAVNMIAGMDQIICPMLLLKIGGPPNGPGVIIGGSTTVLINNLPAGRATDQILEVAALDPNMVAVGCPTVIIGG